MIRILPCPKSSVELEWTYSSVLSLYGLSTRVRAECCLFQLFNFPSRPLTAVQIETMSNSEEPKGTATPHIVKEEVSPPHVRSLSLVKDLLLRLYVMKQ